MGFNQVLGQGSQNLEIEGVHSAKLCHTSKDYLRHTQFLKSTLSESPDSALPPWRRAYLQLMPQAFQRLRDAKAPRAYSEAVLFSASTIVGFLVLGREEGNIIPIESP